MRMQIYNDHYTIKEIIASITQRGQVTIPAEVRRILGAEPRGKIAFLVEGDEVKLIPATFTLEAAYGSVKPITHPQNLKEISRKAKEEHSANLIRKMKR